MWEQPPRASGFLFLELFMTPLLSAKWVQDRASSDQSSLLSPLLLLKGLLLFPLFLEGQLARGNSAWWLYPWGA